MFKKIKLLIVTVSYLKLIQIYFRLYYFLRNRLRKATHFTYKFKKDSVSSTLKFQNSIFLQEAYKNDTFEFLNLSVSFENEIDWNYKKYGKLWTYNLTYFDYLNQKDIALDDGLKLMKNFINNMSSIQDGLEPFPISLRSINWIKFLLRHKIKDKTIDDSLYAQYYMLVDNLEYHLLGNHLLENGFSLLFGACYFDDKFLLQKAEEILFRELNEQILKDGAHFELSPMYHQIMLFRVLDCVNLAQNNSSENTNELLKFLKTKASMMLAWLDNITFTNGNIPLFNDSAINITPDSKLLFDYAEKLNIKFQNIPMKECGYRKFKNELYECIVDVGNIGPDYIPGHAHADTFNFELCIDKQPIVVDTGISTYEANERRTIERSTTSHNTVEINKTSQSEVWGGFRVANRAYATKIQETTHGIKATHNGYEKKYTLLHEREFVFDRNTLEIVDTIKSFKEYMAIARIHFHPDIKEEAIHKLIDLKNLNYKIKNYKFAPKFNTLLDAKVLEIKFTKNLKVTIKI